MAKVPDGATVTTTLDLLAPLAARTDTFWIGNSGNPATKYIVFDSTDSGYSPEPANVPALVASQHPGISYKVIYAAVPGPRKGTHTCHRRHSGLPS